jgi:hypothetical protein
MPSAEDDTSRSISFGHNFNNDSSAETKVKQDLGLSMTANGGMAVAFGALFVLVCLVLAVYIIVRRVKNELIVGKQPRAFTAFILFGAAAGAAAIATLAVYRNQFIEQMDKSLERMAEDPVECLIDGKAVIDVRRCAIEFGEAHERHTDERMVVTKSQQRDELEKNKPVLKTLLVALSIIFAVYLVLIALLYVIHGSSEGGSSDSVASSEQAENLEEKVE